ncbi:hypothetical protein ABZ457_24855, partial [Streptomyces sp. NPDC005805]
MRSARILLASAAVTAALGISAPAAYALAPADDHGKESSSSDKKWEKDDHDKDDHDKGGKYKPHGGVHAGGGALAGVTGDDWKKDDSEKKGGKYKPHGGVHAGGGALAGVTADDWKKDDKDDHDKGGKYKPHG